MNDKLAIFMSVWDSVADEHCPVVHRTVRRPACPWLGDESVREVMAERDEARRIWAASRSVADRDVYRRLRNKAKFVLSRARRSHLTESLHSDPKRFWSRLRQHGADLSARGSIGAPPERDVLSADQLNQYFAGVGARVAAETL